MTGGGPSLIGIFLATSHILLLGTVCAEIVLVAADDDVHVSTATDNGDVAQVGAILV